MGSLDVQDGRRRRGRIYVGERILDLGSPSEVSILLEARFEGQHTSRVCESSPSSEDRDKRSGK